MIMGTGLFCGSHDYFPFVSDEGFLLFCGLGEGEAPGVWRKGPTEVGPPICFCFLSLLHVQLEV